MLGSSAQQREMTHPAWSKEHIIPLYAIIVRLWGCSQGKRGNVSPLSLSPTVLILALFTGRLWSSLGLWSSDKSPTVSRQETGSQTLVSPRSGLCFPLLAFF